MNHIKVAAIGLSLIFPILLGAQSVNWARITPETRHVGNIELGLEHGVVYGISYGYRLPSRLPTLLSIGYSAPSGEEIFDDFKVKSGAQTELFSLGRFRGVAGFQGIYRRLQTDIVRLDNFGCEAGATFGYYEKRWFMAANLGFDKAVVTHFKHSASYHDNFPQVQDGWYEPATGGNVSFGGQFGFSFHRNDLYFKAGKMIVQDWENRPVLPFYAQLGYTRRF